MKNVRRDQGDISPIGTSPDPETGIDDSTRLRVTELILHQGPMTAAALAEQLSLTTAAIRRHLSALTADGLISASEQRVYGSRGRGRPAKVFSLTDAGRARFEHTYDELAAQALRFLAERDGVAGVRAFAEQRVAESEARYVELLADVAEADRAQALAELLSADGFVASTRPAVAGTQLCQHHCPVAHVAEEFPQLCEAEAEAFARLLGVHVQRLATIAHGDGVCTTHIPHLAHTSPVDSTSQSTAPAPTMQPRQSGAPSHARAGHPQTSTTTIGSTREARR